MKEKSFQKWVVDTATAFGWRCWHVPTPMKPVGGNRFVPDSRGRGLSDLILLHADPPRLIFAELKGDDGVLSVEQQEFLRLARRVARQSVEEIDADDGCYDSPERVVGVYVWKPGNEDLIEAILRGKVISTS